MAWFRNRKYLKLQREQKAKALADSLWIWIGTVNLSRQPPREMIGSQNLAKIPNWLRPRIYLLADTQKEHMHTFEEDTDFEYKFIPSSSSFAQSFRCDIYKRVRHWRKIVRKLAKASK